MSARWLQPLLEDSSFRSPPSRLPHDSSCRIYSSWLLLGLILHNFSSMIPLHDVSSWFLLRDYCFTIASPLFPHDFFFVSTPLGFIVYDSPSMILHPQLLLMMFPRVNFSMFSGVVCITHDYLIHWRPVICNPAKSAYKATAWGRTPD